MNEKVEVYPAGFATGHPSQDDTEQNNKVQRQRWWILAGTFLVILLPAFLYIWTRPAVYQSQALIHFSYPSQIGREMADVPVEQITLNQQRLTSYRVLEQLSHGFMRDNYVSLSAQQLGEMLTTSADTDSRTIHLFATGTEPQLLQPLLEQWLAYYIGDLDSETQDDTQQQIQLIEDKLIALEEKIALQRGVVEQFARDNQIISAQREENRTLNKVQGLSSSLDAAQATQADAKAKLSSLKAAIEMGEVVIHPSDGAAIDRLQSDIASLEAELNALAEVYTPVYMQRDPEIVNKQRNLDGLKSRLKDALTNSQLRYLQEAELEAVTADETLRQLQLQFEELNGQAQLFNEKLNTYNRHLEGLTQLETQYQALTDQRTELEVQRPYEAIIRVVEQPFVPSFSIGPPNSRDSLIALLCAAILSVLALLLYSFIVRRSGNPAGSTNYTLVTADPRLVNPQMDSLAHNRPASLSHQPAEKLEHQPQEQAQEASRLLNEQEMQGLYDAANPQTKLVLGLILHGVTQNELLSLQVEQVGENGVEFNEPFARVAALPPQLMELLTRECAGKEPGQLIWTIPLTLPDIEAAVINTAHDAGLSLPDQLNPRAIRHSYLTFLVSQGVRLNDLQNIAGYTEPGALAQYRNVNRKQDLIEVSLAKIGYPLNW